MAAHPKPLPPLPEKLKSARKKVTAPAVHPALSKPAASREPVAAAKAKTHFLQLLEEVERDRKPIVITKRGRVVAQLMPAPAKENISNFDRVFGSMRGTGKIVGDIVSPDWGSWGPEWR